MRAPLPFALVAGLGLSLACAAPCEKVESSHTAFRKATLPLTANARPTPGASDGRAHLSAAIPYAVLDAIIARELGRIPVLKLPLPAVAGVSLGSLRVGVEAIALREAPSGQLGVRVQIGLREGTKPVMSVDVDALVRPRLDPRTGSVVIALAGDDIRELRPSISKASRKQLGDWIWSKLPGAAKMLVDRGAVAGLAGELADDLARQAGGMLERDLLAKLGELVRFELDLPEELPIAAIALRSGATHLEIDLRTPLRVEHGLDPSFDPSRAMPGIAPGLIQARVSGDTAAALVNNAIRDGRIPNRWTLEGEPDPQGEIYAGLGWAEGTRDPLEIHLWKVEGDCAHVVLRGEPSVQVKGQSLEIGTPAARVERVVGSAKVKAGLFFSRTARRGIELVEQTAASTEVEVGTSRLVLQIAAAKVVGDELILGLRLAPAPGAGAGGR